MSETQFKDIIIMIGMIICLLAIMTGSIMGISMDIDTLTQWIINK